MQVSLSEPALTTYVKLLYPGSLYPEETARTVAERDPDAIAREVEPGVFAFEFYDLLTVMATLNGQEVGMSSKPVNRSGLYYIDAVEMSSADVAALPGDHSILLGNMRCNGWDPVLRCRTGNFRPLERGDRLISSGVPS